MNRNMVISAAVIVLWICIGCSGNVMPVVPEPAALSGSQEKTSNVHLWGFYDVYIDVESGRIEASLNRQAMFTANVVNFINGKPAGLGFKINGTTAGSDYVDIDIDITITHPFPGLPQYNGYDVRGAFMGDGSDTLAYNSDLVYPVLGTDQFMLPDPVDGFGGPDGYTRWFNKSEFSQGGMPLFQYTQGKMASAGFDGNATLCPYKYFADELGKNDDLWAWLNNNSATKGVFKSGSSNTRNYYLRFPNAKGIKYGYAILANWDGIEPEKHPANASEAISVKVVENNTVYYVSPTEKGGDLVLDISVWDWDSKISAGLMEDYRIIIESTVLSAPYEFKSSEMTPVGGNENYSTYHVEIDADNVSGLEGNEYWVIVESPKLNYKNNFGVVNLAGDDPLAAFFRYELKVSPTAINLNPKCELKIDPSTPVPAEDFAPVKIIFDASGSSDPDGDPLTFNWDFDGDGVYNEPVDDVYTGAPNKPTRKYNSNYTGKAYVKVTDGKGGEAICSVDVSVIVRQSKNIPLRAGVEAIDLGVDPSNGDLWIIYSDRQNWKYPLSGWYMSGSSQYTAAIANFSIKFMDVASGGFAQMMCFHPTYSPSEYIYNSTGGQLLGMGWGGADNKFMDCTNYGLTGTFANDLMMFMGYYHTSMGINITMVDGYQDPTYNVSSRYLTETYVYTPLTGINKIYHEYLVGIDSAVDGEAFWALEKTDFYCARFRLTGSGWWKTQVYDNAYCGTGTAQSDHTCWTADVVDLSRDSTGRLHVLDLVNGQAVIKVFTGSATGGTAHGSYGDSTTIIGAPVALDGDDFKGRMFVLHGSPSTGYYLSIFVPDEFPA